MSNNDKINNPGDEESNPDADLDSLSLDEKAAFDKIMAEIAASSGDSPQKSPAASDKIPDGLADNDDSTTIDGEPETPGQGDDEEQDTVADEPPTPEADDEDEDLSDDQQDALDKIMAEIEAKKNKETSAPESSEADNENVEPDAGRNKILAESNQPQSKENTDNLSEEEFNDELNQLISSVNQDGRDPSADEPPIPETNTTDTPEPEETTNTPSPEGSAADVPLEDDTTGMDTLSGTGETDGSRPAADSLNTEQDVSEPAPPKNLEKQPQTDRTAQPARSKKLKKPFIALMLVCMLLFAGGGAGWFYFTLKKPLPPQPVQPPDHADGSLQTATTTGQDTEADQQIISSSSQLPTVDPLNRVMNGLAAAQRQTQAKISEIQDLKNYYRKGIDEEADKIEQAIGRPDKMAYEIARKNKQVELSMRSIQRRMVYLHKLDTPLHQLEAASEELLFWERRAQLIEIMKKGVSEISIESFARQAAGVIDKHLNQKNHLSIDDIEVPPVNHERIWQLVTNKIRAKARQRKETAEEDAVNLAIGREICQEDFERKNLLTALSTETARCLLKWSGKDLYLNELTSLPPGVARILAQWPGEWLIMNGLRELPAESAAYLSQWPGKRLSMNGLVKLSPEATAYLSKWQGAQLEMVGLQSIGGWKNYGTRLYLSEKLRRQLEAR